MTPEDITALYARTSQEKDDAFSVDSQIKAGRPFAESNQLLIPPEYEFREDFSGKSLNRPELDKLMKLVREKKVTSVIIYAVDRLARKIGVADMLLDEFMENGVKLWIVSWNSHVRNTPEDRLRFNFEATFSDFERRKIMERTQRGKRDKLSQGIYLGTGRPPYGYIKEGKKHDTHLVINEEEAPVVRNIFAWYAIERVSTYEIVKRLSGIPTSGEKKGFYTKRRTRGNGEWGQTMLYKVLRNPAYIGALNTHGTKIAVPPIVEPHVFAQAQERLAEGRQQSRRNQKYEYLMARRLRCHTCNYSIDSQPKYNRDGNVYAFYYRCPSSRPEKTKPNCHLPGFRLELVDTAVWNFIRELLLNPASLRTMLEDSQKELQERNADLMYRLTRVEDRIKQQERRVTALINEYADTISQGGSSDAAEQMRDLFRRARDDAQQLLTELLEEKERIVVQLEGAVISDELIEDLTKFAHTVRDEIDLLPFAGRREIVETLGLRGELAFEEGQKVLYLTMHTHSFRRELTVSNSC